MSTAREIVEGCLRPLLPIDGEMPADDATLFYVSTAEGRAPADAPLDSLDKVELVMAIEEATGKEVSDENADKLKTLGDFVEWVENAKLR